MQVVQLVFLKVAIEFNSLFRFNGLCGGLQLDTMLLKSDDTDTAQGKWYPILMKAARPNWATLKKEQGPHHQHPNRATPNLLSLKRVCNAASVISYQLSSTSFNEAIIKLYVTIHN